MKLTEFISGLQKELSERGDGLVWLTWEGVQRAPYFGGSRSRHYTDNGVFRDENGDVWIDAEFGPRWGEVAHTRPTEKT